MIASQFVPLSQPQFGSQDTVAPVWDWGAGNTQQPLYEQWLRIVNHAAPCLLHPGNPHRVSVLRVVTDSPLLTQPSEQGAASASYLVLAYACPITQEPFYLRFPRPASGALFVYTGRRFSVGG